MACYYIIMFLVVFIDGWVVQTLMPEESMWSRDLLNRFTTCLIWVPYFLISKRVENTFTHMLNPVADNLNEENNIN